MTSTDTCELTPRHRTEMINGIRQHYVTAGAGEPLLLVHGFPETHHAWRKVIPQLAERFFVIAPDLRGCGDTERPDAFFDKKTVAEDLHALVEHLGLGAINVVGHDVGMMVAYEYAATYRHSVLRTAFIEAAIPGLGLETLYDGSKHPRMYHLSLFEAPNGFAEMLITGREQQFVEHFMRVQAGDPSALEQDALDEYARRLAAPGGLRGGITYFRSHRIDADRNAEHAKTPLSMPVLTVAGTASAGPELRDWVAPWVENLRFELLEDCGHYVAEEQPEQLCTLLIDFLTEGNQS